MQDASVVQWLRDEVEKIPEADTRAMWEALDAVENTLHCAQEQIIDGNDIKMPL